MTGKFANAAAFQIIILCATEVFPTDVRIQAIGILSFVSTISAFAPYATELLVSYIINIHYKMHLPYSRDMDI